MIAVREQCLSQSKAKRMTQEKTEFEDVYSAGELICEGSQGNVYRAYQEDREVAVKIVDRTRLSPKEEEQILREVSIMRDLDDVESTNSVVDFFASSKAFYIVQEVAKGGDVFDWVVNNRRYTEDEARRLATQLLHNIQETHRRGYVHRDIKPENILLVDEEDNTSIRVADFGYADVYDSSKQCKETCGTPGYTAPEVLYGEPYTQAVDLWSIGCVMYFILTGRHAFEGKDTTELLERVLIGKYTFHEQDWDHLSWECMEFVMGLLTVPVERRWTARKALASAWLRPRNQYKQKLQ